MKDFILIRLFYVFTFSILLIYPVQAIQDSTSLLEVAQRDIPLAFENEKECVTLYDKINGEKNPGTLLKGYIGGVNIARSRHAPMKDKRDYLRKGITLLEEAIKASPGNTELLFLRMTIQINLPSFIGYNKNLKADKKFVFENYDSSSPVLQKRISSFVNSSSYFTPEEKALVN